jgi:hypothetical protein
VGEPGARRLPTGAGTRFDAAMAAIDEANAADPVTIVVDGEPVPKELAHARLMTDWVRRLDPDATELQLLAARAHHLRRWEVPRTEYPEGRSGYLRWRAAQKKRHAVEAGDLLRPFGYTDEEVARVGMLIRKEGLARDAQVQTHEDALCLVFIQLQFMEVLEQLGEEKMVEVIRKTLRKMSPQAVEAALALPLDPSARALVERAATT